MTKSRVVSFALVYLVMSISSLFCVAGAAAQTPADTSILSPISWDVRITKSLNHIESPFITESAHVVSESLLPVIVGVPAALITIGNFGDATEDNRFLAETGALTMTAGAATYFVVYSVKKLTARVRPWKKYPEHFVTRSRSSNFSFPSGHAAGSAAFATMVSLRHREWYVIGPSVAWSLATSFSRMHLGVHYFSDVVVGTVLGVGMSSLIYGLRHELRPLYEFVLPEADTQQLRDTGVGKQVAAAVRHMDGPGIALLPDRAILHIPLSIGF